MLSEFAEIFRIMTVLLILDAAIIFVLFFSKWRYRAAFVHRRKTAGLVREAILRSGGNSPIFDRLISRPRLFFSILRELGDSVELPRELHANLIQQLTRRGYVRRVFSQLDSPFPARRLRAVTDLVFIGGESAGERLLARLDRERRWYIRLALMHALARIPWAPAVPKILDLLRGAPHWIRQKTVAVIPAFGEIIDRHLQTITGAENTADIDLLFQLAAVYSSPVLHRFLTDSLESDDHDLAARAAAVFEKTDPRVLIRHRCFDHADIRIRTCGLRSLPAEPTAEHADLLTERLNHQGEESEAVVSALQGIIAAKPLLVDRILGIFVDCGDAEKAGRLAVVLESRLEYLLPQINTARYNEIRKLIETLLDEGRTAVLFGYLDRRTDSEVEEAVLPILSNAVRRSDALAQHCSRYLPEHIAAHLHIPKSLPASQAAKAPLKKNDRRILFLILALIVMAGPILLFTGMHGGAAGAETPTFPDYLITYTYSYNFFFAFYSIAINSIYLLLLIAALFFLLKQLMYWKVRSLRFLFSPELLPSISILAPAFNEEANIVNNVKSLLNLHYPDVEVIVINDGSKDHTLEHLIDHFSLERRDKPLLATIETEPVRGIYTSRDYPGLTVVDKSNGGKADSLNAGINLATKDFICTIDSDSLLEHDALLKIAFQSLLTDREPVAMGGNILPANGCEVRNGRLTKIQLGKNHLVRFQTIEYMRSFLAGRLGWSLFNSMVIISGAFGLFLRRRVIEIGGYLTPRSRMRAGTVGEDMELVVRLHEHLRRKGVRYRVFDAFNANCWTEVPETFKILHRQRDRWHRGLIESVLLHKRMMGNPRFGPVGIFAFPYFLIFELIGPFFEMYGYVNLFISIALGLIDGRVALLMFTAVILYGMLISIGSLIISENEILYFNTRETILIVLYGIIENFGFRQVMSMIRVTAYVTFIFKEKSWGVMERKGLGTDLKDKG